MENILEKSIATSSDRNEQESLLKQLGNLKSTVAGQLWLDDLEKIKSQLETNDESNEPYDAEGEEKEVLFDAQITLPTTRIVEDACIKIKDKLIQPLKTKRKNKTSDKNNTPVESSIKKTESIEKNKKLKK
jgi:hypothetical protein